MSALLEGKIALVTGAGLGIERACALVMAREGATVVVSDVNIERAETTLKVVNAVGGQGMAFAADVSRAADVASLVNATVSKYGRLDCACNNAGVGRIRAERIHEFPEDDWNRTIAINAKGVWLCLKYEISQMLQQGGGSIVNMASAAGVIAVPRASAYISSKHAVVGLTKAAALEYAQDGIRVNAVCPGIIDTPGLRGQIKGIPEGLSAFLIGRIASKRIPIGRLGRAEEVAESVAWLCSNAASLVTGLAMTADGGVTATAR